MLKKINSRSLYKSFALGWGYIVGISFLYYFISIFFLTPTPTSHKLHFFNIQHDHEIGLPLESNHSVFDVEAMLEDTEDEDEAHGDIYHLSYTSVQDSFFNEFVYTSFINSHFSSLILSLNQQTVVPLFLYQHSWKSYLS